MKKKLVVILLCMVLALALGACGKSDSGNSSNSADGTSGTQTNESAQSGAKKSEKEIKALRKANYKKGLLDLTKMSSTAIYSEVFNMMESPSEYDGREVQVIGNFAVAKDDKTGKKYFYCVVPDATKCCQQGLEFVLKNGDSYKYPDDYPAVDAEVKVRGVFESYTVKEAGDMQYCRLKDATIVK